MKQTFILLLTFTKTHFKVRNSIKQRKEYNFVLAKRNCILMCFIFVEVKLLKDFNYSFLNALKYVQRTQKINIFSFVIFLLF